LPASASAQDTKARTILGVTIRVFNREEAIARIDQALASAESLNVCFANAQTLNIAYDNDRFSSALQRFLVLNDGLGVDIVSRVKFGKPFMENLNGTDFVPDFLSKTQHRLRVYLVGTTDAAVKQAAHKFCACYPRHTIVGWRNGFFTGANDIDETCSKIRAARADCVLVGMGNPQQELWIDEHGHKTGAKVLLGVGALFDFEARVVRRAPLWVRALRCEWMYRLLQEPRRLARRYLIGNFIFLGRALADARR
jgi:alpha-1,3-mannosyltransferase